MTYDLRKFFDFSLDMLCVLSEDGLFKHLNPVFQATLGWKSNDLFEKQFVATVHPDDVAVTIKGIEKLKAGVKMISFENRYRCADGSYKEVFWTASKDQKASCFLAIGRDQTEHKELQAHVQHTQKLESLGVLAGGIAHDINNLLTGVLGNADLALMELAPDSNARTMVQDIQKSAVRAADFCKQLLAYSGKGSQHVSTVDINEVIAEMNHLLRASVSKTAAMTYDMAPDLPAIEANPTQLQQIIMNLITNASEAIDSDGGVIALSTGVRDCDTDYLSHTYLDDDLPAGRYLYIEVLDSGSGIRKADFDKIFQPFYSTKESGRGLGLSAVLDIVRSHCGAVDIISQEDEGTIFRILLPCSEAPAVGVQRTISLADEDWSGTGNILVVDDELSVQNVIRRTLDRIGIGVLTAKDGREGLEIFTEKKDVISLVLLDLSMPKMSGEEVLKRIRELSPTVPVILMSGYSEEELRGRLHDQGLDDFLAKPIEVQTLIEKIQIVLSS